MCTRAFEPHRSTVGLKEDVGLGHDEGKALPIRTVSVGARGDFDDVGTPFGYLVSDGEGLGDGTKRPVWILVPI